MKINIFLLGSALALAASFLTSVHAHLMVAQHGTLNFLDSSVYMVLSLPVSAFATADENSDNYLSLEEFDQHRASLIDTVSNQVSLSTKEGKLPLSGLMVSPVTPHDAPKDPAEQLIVMGRFSLDDTNADSELRFKVGLHGKQAANRALEITATRKSENQKQVFEISPESDMVKLTFN